MGRSGRIGGQMEPGHEVAMAAGAGTSPGPEGAASAA